ncbi:tetratricopeptide repeat-containing protein [Terrimicrobium sacchariphilum]|uniref:Tetratricopeptide repeat-containing protein n=1 Tax=Terrimicrobium sacchariphilum TaxID=690879 RepID=A0A146GEN1_TERSA|nr:tetratricopeptide repeat protein [Terrimicrobium sacchariphilum]GAT35134.1 tetratricopeptide repeat-containing protein [Terrimicrobium sacchariphilum]
MPVITEKELPEAQRAPWLKAMSAMELRNYGYAIQLLQGVLKACPNFLVGRQLVRKAAIAKNSGKKSLLGGLSGASFNTIKVQSLIKKDPVAALDTIEKSLENEPHNPAANQLLKEAALAANMPEVAEFALQTIIEGNPKDTKTMHELAKLLLSTGQPQKAVDIYGKIVQVTPNDLAAVKGGKDAAAAASMQRGGWEKEETTYRDLIRNKDEAVALEQQNRVVRSEEMIDNLLADLHARVEQDPSNVDVSRRIAEMYEQKEDLESAVNWYNYAVQLTSGSDSSLVRKLSDLRLKQYDVAIAGYEEYLAANGSAPEAAEYATQLEDIKRQRAALLFEEAQKRVERNPTDLALRFELGEILVAAGNYKDAIPELQRAQQNPSVRLRAMSLLGECYTGRGMYDLASKILEKAKSELYQMDATKKEITYKLGMVFEKMGQADKCIECMKEIYEVDYSFRDVAERVEGSYNS